MLSWLAISRAWVDRVISDDATRVPLISQWVNDPTRDPMVVLYFACVSTILIAIGTGVFTYLFMRTMGDVSQRLVYNLRTHLFSRLQRLSLQFHKASQLGDTMTPQRLIADIVKYAEIARKDGILALEGVTKDIEDDFLVSGVQMAVDGTDPELIEQILTNELQTVADRHATGKAMFDLIAKYAPAFGMIGTLVGLVIMLQNMDDPSKIGPGMAIALLTTLYGTMVANIFASPIAEKLGTRSTEEIFLKTIVIRGVMSIQSGDNPRTVEQKLKTFLKPSLREMVGAMEE